MFDYWTGKLVKRIQLPTMFRDSPIDWNLHGFVVQENIGEAKSIHLYFNDGNSDKWRPCIEWSVSDTRLVTVLSETYENSIAVHDFSSS